MDDERTPANAPAQQTLEEKLKVPSQPPPPKQMPVISSTPATTTSPGTEGQESQLGTEDQGELNTKSQFGTEGQGQLNTKSGDDMEVDWEFWGQVVRDCAAVARERPEELHRQILNGIPATGGVRGQVWQQLAQQEAKRHELEKGYSQLLKEPSTFENAIARDLNRTFPTNEFFQGEKEGNGQAQLFNVMKAYSLYDPEVGYCQGLSFIAGALLLNMPDEEAFTCLISLMEGYGLHDLYTPTMTGLQVLLYQFQGVLEYLLPELASHFKQQGIEASMYASQWFLTLFLYRLPLDLVFRMLDVLFYEGFQAIFRFSFAMLAKNKEQLLELEFEPLLAFLKHSMHLPYLEKPDELVTDAFRVFIRPLQMNRLRKEYEAKDNEEDSTQLELARLKKRHTTMTLRQQTLKQQVASLVKRNTALTKGLEEYKTQFSEIREQQEATQVTVAILKDILVYKKMETAGPGSAPPTVKPTTIHSFLKGQQTGLDEESPDYILPPPLSESPSALVPDTPSTTPSTTANVTDELPDHDSAESANSTESGSNRSRSASMERVQHVAANGAAHALSAFKAKWDAVKPKGKPKSDTPFEAFHRTQAATDKNIQDIVTTLNSENGELEQGMLAAHRQARQVAEQNHNLQIQVDGLKAIIEKELGDDHTSMQASKEGFSLNRQIAELTQALVQARLGEAEAEEAKLESEAQVAALLATVQLLEQEHASSGGQGGVVGRGGKGSVPPALAAHKKAIGSMMGRRLMQRLKLSNKSAGAHAPSIQTISSPQHRSGGSSGSSSSGSSGHGRNGKESDRSYFAHGRRPAEASSSWRARTGPYSLSSSWAHGKLRMAAQANFTRNLYVAYFHASPPEEIWLHGAACSKCDGDCDGPHNCQGECDHCATNCNDS